MVTSDLAICEIYRDEMLRIYMYDQPWLCHVVLRRFLRSFSRRCISVVTADSSGLHPAGIAKDGGFPMRRFSLTVREDEEKEE